jgi:hypothetical protein
MMFDNQITLKYSKVKFLTFFAIICSIGLAPINDASATTTFTDAFPVSAQDILPTGLAFNNDGTKMFVVGNAGQDVNEYNCTAFDVSTCVVDAGVPFSVSAQDTVPTGLAFNNDGTKMFVAGYNGGDVNEYACTTGFDVSSCGFTDAFSVSTQETSPEGLAFNNDGTKMFVVGAAGDDVNEYACTTGFDVSTCVVAGNPFSVAAQETTPRGLAFNNDGTKMFVVGSTGDDVNEYFISPGFAVADPVNTGADCYDCTPPVLQNAHITISSNDYVVATGDDPIHITANVGDKVTILLNVTDNISVDTIPFAGLYTNYQEKPSDMSAFYANNFDKWKHVSTSFYEWNIRSDDVPYDYDGTISWSKNTPTIVTAVPSWNKNTPTIVTDVITEDNFKFKNKDQNTVEYFMMPFTFTMSNSMEESTISAKIYDYAGNRLHVTLPVTLEIIPKETVVLSDDEEIATLDKGDLIVTPSEDTLPLLNESILFAVLSQWSGYSQVTSDDAEVLSTMGLQGDSLPAWTKNLGEWVIQEKLDVSELITAINYVNNQ